MDVTKSGENPGGNKTVVLRNGERFILPPGAQVTSVITEGSILVNSTCSLPPATSYACGYFYIILDNDDNDGHSMDEQATYYVSIKVAGKTYNIGRKIIYDGDNPGRMTSAGMLNTHVTDKAIFAFTAVAFDRLSKRQGIWLYFKTPQDLMSTVELKVDNNGSAQYYKPETGVCGEFPFGSIMPEDAASAKDIILGSN